MEKNQNSGMSRREFLKTSALFGAMLSVAPLAGACASKTGAVPVPAGKRRVPQSNPAGDADGPGLLRDLAARPADSAGRRRV